MKKEQFEIWAIDYLRKDLTKPQVQEFDAFLEKNESFRIAFEELKNSWAILTLEEVPRPSEEMDTKFYGLLYSEKGNSKNINEGYSLLKSVFVWFRPQYAFGLMLLLLGLVGGYFIKQDKDPTIVQSMEVEENLKTHEKLVLTLLEQPSANQRLDGVSEANKIGKVDDKIVDALLKTLNGDPNVNVRLAAVESLTNYIENARVRQGLVQSIPYQESPIVQVTLANLMMALQERKSVEPFKKLLEEKELDTTVKKKIESTIQSII